LFPLNGSGIVSKRDSLAFQNSKSEIKEKIIEINSLSCDEIKRKFSEISWESRDGKVEYVKNNITKYGLNDNLFVKFNFRLFDVKWTYYTGESKGFIGWPVKQIMQHLLNENIALICSRQSSSDWKHIFISKFIGDFNITGNAGTNGSGYYFPLYLYPDEKNKDLFADGLERKPNLNLEIVNKIANGLVLSFVEETPMGHDPLKPQTVFSPIDLLDYIYAVLHSPNYREKYKEFLKIDFPRVPYPKDLTTFKKLSNLGSQIRQIHLLESPIVENYITQYPEDGNNEVGKIFFEKTSDTLGRVYINYEKTPHLGVGGLQYFDNVPEVAWNFYIGGYQPAQKWLKDRKERKLEFDDILHYQKIIVALSETDRLMKEINKIDIE
jgi:predicted helicase